MRGCAPGLRPAPSATPLCCLPLSPRPHASNGASTGSRAGSPPRPPARARKRRGGTWRERAHARRTARDRSSLPCRCAAAPRRNVKRKRESKHLSCLHACAPPRPSQARAPRVRMHSVCASAYAHCRVRVLSLLLHLAPHRPPPPLFAHLDLRLRQGRAPHQPLDLGVQRGRLCRVRWGRWGGHGVDQGLCPRGTGKKGGAEGGEMHRPRSVFVFGHARTAAFTRAHAHARRRGGTRERGDAAL